MSARQGGSDKRILGWLGWAGADALGRLALLTGGTALFSRLLSPRDFGVTALVLTFVAVGAVFVGMPFEEALAQRRRLRRIHLRAALGVSVAVGVLVMAVATALGLWLARVYGEPEIAAMMPAAMVSVFFTGHTAILLALARRLRRFNDVARASLIGHLVGVGASLVLALAGAGPWALIANRVLIAVGVDLALQWRLGFLVLPRWSPAHVDGFGRFAGVSFLERLADNLTYLLFNNMVEAFYGSNVLGLVNMAMRVVEPIRGAVAATGHNLAFSFFAPAAHDPRRLAGLAEDVTRQSALIVAPMFAGLAAVTPVLLPILAGPGWDDAVSVAVCLSIGAALAQPPRLILTALSAAARPEYALAATAASLAATLAALLALSPLGPFSVGLARIVGDAARLAVSLGLVSPALAWPRAARLKALAPAFALSLAMALIVARLGTLAPPGRALIWLGLMLAAGVTIYAALLSLFAKPFFARLVALARPAA
jgi:O-antigen/teichoic acid export membrane protein